MYDAVQDVFLEALQLQLWHDNYMSQFLLNVATNPNIKFNEGGGKPQLALWHVWSSIFYWFMWIMDLLLWPLLLTWLNFNLSMDK